MQLQMGYVPETGQTFRAQNGNSLSISHQGHIQEITSSVVVSVAALQSSKRLLGCAVNLLAKGKGLEPRAISDEKGMCNPFVKSPKNKSKSLQHGVFPDGHPVKY